MKGLVATITFLVLLFIGYLTIINKPTIEEVKNEQEKPLRIISLAYCYPKINQDSSMIISYQGFDLSYNEEHEQANWVVYILTKEETTGNIERTDNFRVDTNIQTKSACPNDYVRSGYDKGHLAPAADMSWSEKSMKESFLMSNMSPQAPSFNRGIWKQLEEQVREWAVEFDSLLIITGPVFKQNLGEIGKNQVTIPGYYYKVIFDISWPEYKMVAFLMKNEKSDREIFDFAITLDSLESFTGYDYFYNIKDARIHVLEKTLEMNVWK